MFLFSHSIAFVEFKNKTIARKIQQKKQQVKMQGRVLIVDFVGETNATNSSKVIKTNGDNNSAKGKSLAIYRVAIKIIQTPILQYVLVMWIKFH